MTGQPAPGFYVQPPREADASGVVRMDVVGFVGVAARGPLDTAVAIDGWPQFVAIFGEFLPNAHLAYAVRAFFDNGGRRCHVVRVAAPEVAMTTAGVQPADRGSSTFVTVGAVRPGALATLLQQAATATVGPQPADRRSSAVVKAAGFYPGARVLVTQAGQPPAIAVVVAADVPTQTVTWRDPLPAGLNLGMAIAFATELRDRRLVAGVAANSLSWDHPLDERFDLSLPIEARAGAGAAAAVIPDETGAALLRVTASSPGQWGDELAVRVTRTVASESRTRKGAPPSATLLTLERTLDLAPGATVEVLQAGVAPVRRIVAATDNRRAQITLDAALAGFDLAGAQAGTKPIMVRRLAFALSVSRRGRAAELFGNLDLPTLTAPTVSRVNTASTLIRIERLAGALHPWPDATSGLLEQGQVRLLGGRDGIAMLRPQDVTGRADAAQRLGLRLFELQDEPAAIAIPDAVIEPMSAVVRAPLPETPEDPCDPCPCPRPPHVAPMGPPPMIEASPAFGLEETLAVQQALVEHCEIRGDRMALLDPPRARDLPDPYDLDSLTAWRQHFDSAFGATYFPWLVVTDPIATPPNLTRTVPASGHALGQFALADLGPGTHTAPANQPLAWTSGLPRVLTTGEHGVLNEIGINCIRGFSGRGIRISGARTFVSHPDWKLLNIRRYFILLRRVLERALRFAVLEPNDRGLSDSVIAVIESFLENEWQAQHLAGAVAEEAFFVRNVTTQDNFDNGQFVLEIGVSPVVPAEYVVLRLTRSEDRLDLVEMAGGLA